jgi:predicted transposase YdaD
VETDRPIKVLFERQGQSLLPFIGEREPGVRVAAVESIQLPVSSRSVDSVLRLEREGLVWYRHLEFQAGPDPDMPRRCFEYNSRLILHYDAAVFTTVVYLLPGADRGAQDGFRLYVGNRLAYEWRFDVVRLWQIDAELALQTGEAGPLALVPLLRGGDERETLLAAVAKLDALPRAQAEDAMSILLDLTSQRYDRATFLNVLGKDRAMQSWLYQMGRDEGESKGREEGQVLIARQICSDLVKATHPRVARSVLPRIEQCAQAETLRGWILECPRLSDAAFAKLVTGRGGPRAARARVSASPSKPRSNRSAPAKTPPRRRR